MDLVVGRSDKAVVLLNLIRAFPTGLQISLTVRVRQPTSHGDLAREGLMYQDPVQGDTAGRAGRRKWGFGFADGRRVTNVDPPPDHPPISRPGDALDWMPDHPMLMTNLGGSNGPRAVDMDAWLWPLPPPGAFQMVVNGSTRASSKRCMSWTWKSS